MFKPKSKVRTRNIARDMDIKARTQDEKSVGQTQDHRTYGRTKRID